MDMVLFINKKKHYESLGTHLKMMTLVDVEITYQIDHSSALSSKEKNDDLPLPLNSCFL